MNQQVRITAAPAPFAADAFTATDFLTMLELGAFQDMRAELAGGVIEKMAPAHGDHGKQNAEIVLRLAEALGRKIGYATDLAVVIDARTVRGVDIAVARSTFPKGPSRGSDLRLAIEMPIRRSRAIWAPKRRNMRAPGSKPIGSLILTDTLYT